MLFSLNYIIPFSLCVERFALSLASGSLRSAGTMLFVHSRIQRVLYIRKTATNAAAFLLSVILVFTENHCALGINIP